MIPRPLALGIVVGFIAFSGLISWMGKRNAALPAGPVCEVSNKVANLDFTLKDLTGRDVRLKDFAGKVLLVDFWATWCGPCKVEIPGFVTLYDRYRDQGLEVLGLVSMDEMKNVPGFVAEYGVNYRVLNAIDREDIELAFGPIIGLPTTIVIGRDGKVCSEHLGYTPFERFEAQIRSLL